VDSDFDRDNSIDALLKGARRESIAQEAGPACLDAETLAAWADGALDADRVRAIEAHVADCVRCQTLSAAFFAANEDVPVTAGPKVVPFRRNRIMYWLPIAAGTIAATLVIWLGVRDRNDVMPQANSVADSRAAEAPRPAAGEPQLQARQEQHGNVTAPVDAKRLDRKAAEAVELRADRAKPETAGTANQFRKAAEPVASPAAGKVMAPPAPTPVAVPPPPAIAPPPAPVAVTAASPVIPSTTTSGTVAGQAAGVGGGVRQSSIVMSETVVPRVLAEFSSVLAQNSTINGLPTTGGVVGGVAGAGAGAGRGGRAGGGGAGGRGAPIALDAVSVGAVPFYWRILSTDVIERSIDKLTWEAVAIDPAVQGLAGGAAPSATVCWIIGRAGLVLRTTDGKEFRRVTPPAPADLVSITAQDALRASVTTAGGQTFTTTDGGKSWR
jgi:hypothetical protein